jgi:carbamoyltransferase
MYTLGINAAFHDPAACLVKDGRILAAAEEERFTHIKHGKRPVPFSTYELPFQAIDYCLREAGIRLVDVDHVGYSFDPWLLVGNPGNEGPITLAGEPRADHEANEWQSAWAPLFLASIINAPHHLANEAPHHLLARLRGVRSDGPYRWHFIDHHVAHAASAFHTSPFQRAAVLTLDGRGERASTTYSMGHGTRLERLGQVDLPHSLGLLYAQVTHYLGFLHCSDEYKVMALASFGKPRYVADFRDIVRVEADGQYIIQPLRLPERFGPPRQQGAPLEQRHYEIACSLQVVLEETAMQLIHWLHDATRADNLCLAGGVALNCAMNSHVRDNGPFRRVWVQPAAGDAGTALGAALWVDLQERCGQEQASVMDHVFPGPAYGDREIEHLLQWSKLPYRRFSDVAEETADLLTQQKVIGWFQGRMEFGPRALGARSILASPLHATMSAKLNEIKDREDFRPVAPVVVEEEAEHWFTPAGASPFMLFLYDVLPDKAKQIPAVCHVDGTARIQTIRRTQNALFYDLLKAFPKANRRPDFGQYIVQHTRPADCLHAA